MNITEIRTLNAMALHNLSHILGISEEDTDKYIKGIRADFMECPDSQISEAIPRITETRNKDDIMAGAILAIFMSDFYFDNYMEGEPE